MTAAVPPTAALIAFGLLMRQVHGLVADEVDTAPAPVDTVAVERDTTVSTPVPTPAIETALGPAPVSPGNTPPLAVDTVVSTPAALSPAEAAPAPAPALVICGDHLPIPDVPPRSRLSTEAAAAVIEQAWRDRLSLRE
ncbi:hypothetical protein ACFTWQ_34610, partial [[Kitasatospora] papulosa]